MQQCTRNWQDFAFPPVSTEEPHIKNCPQSFQKSLENNFATNIALDLGLL